MHRIHSQLLDGRVSVLVVGAGGTGSAFAGGLPWLHQSMLAFGHPGGLGVTLIDGDVVSPANCVRQAFTASEVGLPKADVIITRINAFFGLDWTAVPGRLGEQVVHRHDIVVGCVDSRRSRAAIAAWCQRHAPSYWLDIGNNVGDGQFLLGEPTSRAGGWRERRPASQRAVRLPTVADLYPELIEPSLDDDTLPSCSAAEALTRQAPFVNQVLANHALFLLAELFRYGRLEHHGAFVNPRTGHANPIPVPPRQPLSKRQLRQIAALRQDGWPLEMVQYGYELDADDVQLVTAGGEWLN